MNKLIRILTVLNLSICAARADQFQLQLKEPAATAGFSVSYARINITGEHAFSGVTDKLGRIAITGLPNGTYAAKVTDTQEQAKSATFIIDGQPDLKPVFLQ